MVAKSSYLHIHFSRSGEGPPVILMHGLFGMGGNLGALARSLQGEYSVYSLDLPNHGRSGWLADSTLGRLACAVVDWMDGESLESAAFIGHSLGGKVAMEIALAASDRVAALVVADIAPVAYPHHHDAVFAALDAVLAAECRSRAEAAELMSQHLQEEGVIQFLLMSLQRTENGSYAWRFNLEGIKRDYDMVRAEPDVDHPYPGPVMFVKGGESDYILPEHRPRVVSLFPSVEMKVMAGCGHWLHAQQPALFNSIVGRFLLRVYSGGE